MYRHNHKELLIQRLLFWDRQSSDEMNKNQVVWILWLLYFVSTCIIQTWSSFEHKHTFQRVHSAISWKRRPPPTDDPLTRSKPVSAWQMWDSLFVITCCFSMYFTFEMFRTLNIHGCISIILSIIITSSGLTHLIWQTFDNICVPYTFICKDKWMCKVHQV